MSRPRSGARRRARRRNGLAAVLVVLLAALLGCLGPAAATQATGADASDDATDGPASEGGEADGQAADGPADGEPDGQAAGSPATVRVELVSVGPAVVEPTSTLVVRATVVNDSAEPLPAGLDVDLLVQRSQLSTRSSVAAWAELEPDDTPVGSLAARRRLDTGVPSGGRVAVELSVPAADLRLRTSAAQWGPRGLSVLLRQADGRRLAVVRSHLVWLPARGFEAPTAVAVAVPLTAGAPDPTTGTLPADRVRRLTSPGAPLDAALAAGAPGVGLALDPALVDPAVADPAWTGRLRAATEAGRVMLLPYGDADLSSLAHAGAVAVAELAVGRARAVADAALGAGRYDPVAWPPAGDVDAEVLARLRTLGYRSVVLPDAAVAPEREPRSTLTGRADLDAGDGTLTGLLADTALSAALAAVGPRADPGTAGRDSRAAAAVQRLLAETAAITLERPSDPRTVLVTAPRGWAPTPAAAAAAVQALTGVPWVSPAGIQALADTPAPDVVRPAPQLTPAERAEELPAPELRRLDRELAVVRDLTSALADPAPTASAAERTSVALSSAAWRGDGLDAWRAALDTVTAGRAALQGAVRVVPGSPLTQVSREVELPVTIENTLDQAVSVVLGVRSTSSRLAITGDLPVEVAARSTELAQVPVRGVGSGEATVVAQARAPGGTAFGEPVSTRVTVRADWESRGTLAAGAAAGIVLVVGLVRSIRRGRRPQGHDPLADDP